MALTHIAIFVCLQACFIGVQLHPERPPMMDPTEARQLFKVAETNRTADGQLTHSEVDDIFSVFDENGDNLVTQAEFRTIWLSRELGDEVSADYLFARADTDQDGSITQFPDMQRVFQYFDVNGDGKVNEMEFVIIWNSLSS
ncbi:uncharacterized protein LOC143276297 [Babylonia areolata]|uniref:uncharacterized protein LOC143276297 n=1 Tax=Babylonia areolata TaxID=304850 RepID=UPI003FD62C02